MKTTKTANAADGQQKKALQWANLKKTEKGFVGIMPIPTKGYVKVFFRPSDGLLGFFATEGEDGW
jgi:hypothetical protein